MEAPVIKAIIFDCFGVLYTDSKTAVRSLIPDTKQQQLTDIYSKNDYGYISRSDFLNEVAELAGISSAELQAVMSKEHSLNMHLKRYLQDDLRGRYQIGLLSNIGRGWINEFFDAHQLHELFDEVVLSGEEHLKKPDPAIFELTAVRLGLETKECVMIDDIEENCDGANYAGMQAIQYVSNDQLIKDLQKIGIS